MSTRSVVEAVSSCITRLAEEGFILNWLGLSSTNTEGRVMVGSVQFTLIAGALKAEGYEEIPDELSLFKNRVSEAIRILSTFGYRLQISRFLRQDGRLDFFLEAVLRSWQQDGDPYGVILSLHLGDGCFESGRVEALLQTGGATTDTARPKVQVFETGLNIRIGPLKGLQTIIGVHRVLESILGPDYPYLQVAIDGGEWVITLPSIPSELNFPALRGKLAVLGLRLIAELVSGRYRL